VFLYWSQLVAVKNASYIGGDLLICFFNDYNNMARTSYKGSQGTMDMLLTSPPCMRLARGKFELTNQDSAGGKNSGVLTSSWNQATFVTGDGFFHERGFTISKTKPVGTKILTVGDRTAGSAALCKVEIHIITVAILRYPAIIMSLERIIGMRLASTLPRAIKLSNQLLIIYKNQ